MNETNRPKSVIEVLQELEAKAAKPQRTTFVDSPRVTNDVELEIVLPAGLYFDMDAPTPQVMEKVVQRINTL